jgi:hypothetical protein
LSFSPRRWGNELGPHSRRRGRGQRVSAGRDALCGTLPLGSKGYENKDRRARPAIDLAPVDKARLTSAAYREAAKLRAMGATLQYLFYNAVVSVGSTLVTLGAAYKSNGGRKVLHAVEQQAGRGAVAITFEQLMEESGLCRSSVRYGVKQAQLLGFIAVSMGPRRTNEFKLTDGWRGLSADEAKRRVAQARLPTPSQREQRAAQSREAGQAAGQGAGRGRAATPAASAVNANGAMDW